MTHLIIDTRQFVSGFEGKIIPFVKTPQTPTCAMAGTISAQILAANDQRAGVIIINTSANVVSLAFNEFPAVLYSGVTLFPNGGALEMDGSIFTDKAINAVASGANSNLAIQEFNYADL